MKKYDFLDLVSRGTHSRNEVKPQLVVEDGDFKKGTILDANSVASMVDAKVDDALGINSESVQSLVDVLKDGSSITGLLDMINDKPDRSELPVIGNLGEVVDTPAVYSYVSYDSTGDVQYGEGQVRLSGNILTSGDNEYAEAEIIADTDSSFIGRKFYIDNTADPDGETLYQLYDSNLDTVDLGVKVTLVTAATYRQRTVKEYVDYKFAQLSNS